MRQEWEQYLFDYDPNAPDEEFEASINFSVILNLIEARTDEGTNLVVRSHPLMKNEVDTGVVKSFVSSILWLYLSHAWRFIENNSAVYATIDMSKGKELSL